jgi:CelD/BcsL family acetyltransferase involved in cellulose biosynthesis
MISFEIIEEPDKIKEYYAQWDQLFDSGEYESSLSLYWTEALLKTHLEGDAFLLVILRDSTEILGIVPLCIREKKKYGLPLLTVFPISEYFNTHSDLLLKNSQEELMEVFIKALLSLKYNWDMFKIDRFIETNPVLDRVVHNLKNNFALHYVIRREEPSFFIELGNSNDDYLANKSSNFRYNLKRVSKKLHSLGNILFLKNQDFYDFDEIYETILSIEETSWKHKHGTAITSSEKSREFYRELCKGAFNKGQLRFCFLFLNHEPIAFEMGLLKGNKYYGVHGSYNEKFKKENPGTMLLAQFITDLIHDGIKEYDWFGEPFEWESRWTDKFRWHKSLVIYNNTPKAKLIFCYHTLRNKLTQNEQDQIVLRNPRDIKPAQN